VPIYIGATGPKALRLAGRVADGVVIGAGIRPEVIHDSLAAVRAGAEEAGRSLSDLDVRWLVVANLADDDATALEEIKPSLATFANVAFKSTKRGKQIPPEYDEALHRLHAEYDAMDHGVFGGTRQAELCDEYGLTPYLEERFALSGTPERFLAQVERARAAGAQRFWLALRVPPKERILRLWRDEVLPRLG
jgi:5,10-methylenetetrahydromethanopterin reductase